MQDVAAAAGVSIKTVSRVINGEPGVAPATALLIQQEVVRLGYRPNDLARRLRRGRAAETVGLVIGDVANPFYSEIAASVEAALRKLGYVLITASTQERATVERELIAALAERRVDGLIVIPAAGDQGWLREEMVHGPPLVFADRPPIGLDADHVTFDNVGGARTAVEHLIDVGWRRIAIITDEPELFTARERLRGYVEALEARGIHVDEALIRQGCRTSEEAKLSTTQLLQLADAPDAILATNNRITYGVISALAEASKPAGLVGFDTFEFAELLGITVVAGSTADLGTVAVELLVERLEGSARPVRSVVLPTSLVVRGSCRSGPLLGARPTGGGHEERDR